MGKLMEKAGNMLGKDNIAEKAGRSVSRLAGLMITRLWPRDAQNLALRILNR